jgi:glycosyltransferase involved in cell wall biosynthesis
VAAPLAIVIPGYKPQFIGRTLESIAAQTDRRFNVYVGDDASPGDLATICGRFQDRIPLAYTRFEHNLGQRDLVAHWERCIALSCEPWIWLFSDDDVMEPGCVAAVLDRIERDRARVDLYHFDVTEIDKDDREVRQTTPFPEKLPALDFLERRLQGTLSSYAPDYVFSRSALQACGGFESFPAAWASDDATWIKLGRRTGIHAIRGPRVRWRRSGQNISSAGSPQTRQKLAGAARFLGWLARYLEQLPPDPSEPSRSHLMDLAWRWMQQQRIQLGVGYWGTLGPVDAWHLRRAHDIGLAGTLWRTGYLDVRAALRGW